MVIIYFYGSLDQGPQFTSQLSNVNNYQAAANWGWIRISSLALKISMGDISDTPEINGDKPNDTEKARNFPAPPCPSPVTGLQSSERILISILIKANEAWRSIVKS